MYGCKLVNFHGNTVCLSENIAKSFRGSYFFESYCTQCTYSVLGTRKLTSYELYSPKWAWFLYHTTQVCYVALCGEINFFMKTLMSIQNGNGWYVCNTWYKISVQLSINPGAVFGVCLVPYSFAISIPTIIYAYRTDYRLVGVGKTRTELFSIAKS